MNGMRSLNTSARRWSVAAGLCLALVGFSPVAARAAGRSSPEPRASVRPGLVPPGLCESVAQLGHLVVRRFDAYPQNHIHFSFPVVVTVTEPAAVRAAAKAVCALPPMPDKALHCPADLGITYRLSFTSELPPSQEVETLEMVVVSATGCEGLTGLGRTRWAATSPHFWPDLGRAMALKHPSWAIFRGSGGAAG